MKDATWLFGGPMLPDKRVGRLTVKGNHGFATVCKPGLVRAAVHVEDDDKPHPGEAESAFERCVAWAGANQDKAGPYDELFG